MVSVMKVLLFLYFLVTSQVFFSNNVQYDIMCINGKMGEYYDQDVPNTGTSSPGLIAPPLLPPPMLGGMAPPMPPAVGAVALPPVPGIPPNMPLPPAMAFPPMMAPFSMPPPGFPPFKPVFINFCM